MSEPRRPNPLLARLGKLLEVVLNRAVGMDPETRQRLVALDGRAVSVDFKGTPLAMRIAVEGDVLRVGPAFGGESALRLAASPFNLLALALRGGAEDSVIPPGKMEIAGDAELARRLEKIASGFRPDIEEAFASTFGDILGVPMARAFSGAFRFVRERGKRFVEDSAEYLVEEGRDLIAPGEMHVFLDDVDTLRERSDRLEARVKRLLARTRAAEPGA